MFNAATTLAKNNMVVGNFTGAGGTRIGILPCPTFPAKISVYTGHAIGTSNTFNNGFTTRAAFFGIV